jgi:hypothetical protein
MTNIFSKNKDNYTKIIDSLHNYAHIGLFGEQIQANRIPDFSTTFYYGVINENVDVNKTLTGDGTATATNRHLVISSSSSGTATIQSKKYIQYRAGNTAYCIFTASFSGTGTSKAGAFDSNDGFYIKVVNNVAAFGYLKNGVETSFNFQENFKGNINPDSIDWNKLNVFKIMYGYLGSANASLWIKLDQWYVLDYVQTENKLTGTHVNNPVLPVCFYAENGATLKTASFVGGILNTLGIHLDRPTHFPSNILVNGVGAEDGQMTLSGANVGTLAIFKSKSTYNTYQNKIKSKLLDISFHVDTPSGSSLGTVIFQIIKNGTFSGTPSYTDLHTTNSVIEYDSTAGTGATVNCTDGTTLFTFHVAYSGANKGGTVSKSALSADRFGAFLYANDTISIIAKDLGGNDVTVRFSITWEELF